MAHWPVIENSNVLSLAVLTFCRNCGHCMPVGTDWSPNHKGKRGSFKQERDTRKGWEVVGCASRRMLARGVQQGEILFLLEQTGFFFFPSIIFMLPFISFCQSYVHINQSKNIISNFTIYFRCGNFFYIYLRL